MPSGDDPGRRLRLVLERSRDRGLLGAGPVDRHIEQARAFSAAMEATAPGVVVDLGSGGGVPGLPLAAWHREVRWLLVEANRRRAAFLSVAVGELGLGDRCRVRHVRAEVLGRDEAWRGSADVVVARSFGSPGVVAECGSPLLRPGGMLIVSEPPVASDGRWSREGLRSVGLEMVETTAWAGYRLARLARVAPCPERFPRRPGVPERSPLF